MALPDFTSLPTAGNCSRTMFGLISLVKMVSTTTAYSPSDFERDRAVSISSPSRFGVKTVFLSLM